MKLAIIAAAAENNVIGYQGKIPWHYKEDFLHFKKLTTNHTVIMGRKTWESLPIKPLPNRKNIILTRNKEYKNPNALIYNSLEDAIDACKNDEYVFIIGGERVYNDAMKFADTIELTRVHDSPKGDRFFPKIDSSWALTKETPANEYTFQTYIKKS